MLSRSFFHYKNNGFSIRRPILLPLLGMLLFLLTAFVLSTAWLVERTESYFLKQEIQHVSEQFRENIVEQTQFFKHQMVLLTKSDTLRQFFLAGEREALMREGKIVLDSLQWKQATHLLFHLPDRVNFLRVHQPALYGDRVDRPTLLKAEQSGEIAFGVEIGSVGGPTLRAVMPWRDGETLIGYLELGREIEHVVAGLKTPSGGAFYTFIPREYLDNNQWRDASLQFSIGLDRESFSDLVFIGPQGTHYLYGLEEYIASGLWKNNEPLSSISPVLGIEHGHFFAVSASDTKDHIVCRIIGYLELTPYVTMVRNHTIFMAVITISIALLLAVSFNILLSRVESRIRQTFHTLEHTMQSRAAISSLLETGMESFSIEDQLQAALEVILGIPWLSLEKKGSIYLTSEDGEHLVTVAQMGLPTALLNLCAKIAFGFCLCGRAAQQQEIVFAAHLDDDHEIRTPDMHPHGHYCVPILFGKRLMGVLNLYLRDEHVRNAEEEAFLTTIADTLANLIEQRRSEEKLKHIAGHDFMTGLPNRALFQVRMNESISEAVRSGGEVVLMLIDLDRFKQVNDTMGHKEGDTLLKKVTQRILACLRQYDFVARLGGDEFIIILPQLTHVYYVEFIARRILEELAKPFYLGAGEASISGSIGIATFPRDARDMESLLKNADAAMYCAKNAGRNAFCFFTEEMQSAAMGRLQMEGELRVALQNQEFVLHYQPKLDLASNKIIGMEALVRWQKPDGESFKLVPPDIFIPLAEEIGLIVPLGAWVLQTACRQNKAWQEQGLPPMRVAVNLSAIQFKNSDALVEVVRGILQETLLDPEFLELEITESMVMEDAGKAIQTMKIFKAMRIKLSIDDFGTGYSSLGALRKFPVHALKIDKSFVRDLADENSDEAAIVQAIIAMSKRLHLRVVAEGVETKEQLAFLRNQLCDEIQGYYFSRPLPADAFAEFLQRHIALGGKLSREG